MAKPSILAKAAPASKAPAASRGDSKPVPVDVAGPIPPLLGAEFELGAVAAGQFPPSGAREIAFAGRSNAGKSSAINALARRRGLARASRTPGRTREINFYRLRDGAKVADLPGYGYAAVPGRLKERWQNLLWEYVSARTQLIGLVLVIDARHGLRDLDRELLGGFLPSCRPVLILATKSDKLSTSASRSARSSVLAEVGTLHPAHAGRVAVVAFSASVPMGLDAADAVIAGWLG